MTENQSFVANFKANKDDQKKLKTVMRKYPADKIAEEIIKNVDEKGLGMKMWFDVLSLMKDEEKLFEIVKTV
jgi:hypothetical protein